MNIAHFWLDILKTSFALQFDLADIQMELCRVIIDLSFGNKIPRGKTHLIPAIL